MASRKSSIYIEHIAPASFSFDNTSQKQPPRRSIDQYLRLKTNQSLEQKPIQSIQLRRDRTRPIRTEQSDIDGDHHRRLALEEYDLRMESLIKQYQLRLSKQQQYYGLRQWKLKEQLQNLQRQNNALNDELRRFKNTSKQVQGQCSLCNDGQVISQLTKLLTENEQNHKNCLSEKKNLNHQTDEALTKLNVLQEEHEKTCQQLRHISKQMRLYQAKIREVEEERDLAMRSIDQNDRKWRQKLSSVEQGSKQLQREIAQRNMELNQSKATVQSTQSMLANTQQSMKSSIHYVRDTREDKQNDFAKNRKSISKMIAIQDEAEDESRVCLKKFSENLPKNGKHQKYQLHGWKYF